MAVMRSSLNRAAALMLLLLCSAGVNARMLQQAATPTPAPTSSPTLIAGVRGPAPTPASSSATDYGGDRDANGCIPSAGYTWCESTQACVREWETPCPVENGGAMPGSGRDANGCIPSAGYTWCESTQACVREWETPCPVDTPAGTPAESYACPAGPGNSAGGWSEIEDPQSDAGADAAVNYVLQSIGQENEAYTVDFACSQVVAGTNFYLVVSLGNGDKFTATVYQQLPAGNGGDGSFQITSISM